MTKDHEFFHNGVKMKSIAKLPLYLGLAVLVFSVLMATVKVGQKQTLTDQRSNAAGTGATLSLNFTPPNLVSVLLNSDVEVAGTDVTINFDSSKLTILPSTLAASPSFITTGGKVDDKEGTFSFSAISKSKAVTSGIVASFEVNAKNISDADSTELHFVTTDNQTTVINLNKQNILSQSTGVTLNLNTK